MFYPEFLQMHFAFWCGYACLYIVSVIGTDAISGPAAANGPAAEYMKAAGIEPSALGLSRMYSSVCGHMIIDTKDKKLSTKIREQEMKVYETKITMKTLEAEEALASFMIKQVKI